jgi:hypothetical protein
MNPRPAAAAWGHELRSGGVDIGRNPFRSYPQWGVKLAPKLRQPQRVRANHPEWA